jgi:hypothetical protein
LKPRTINACMATANITHRRFKGHDLLPELKTELMKLMNNNDDIDEDYIISHMEYLKDITSTIET